MLILVARPLANLVRELWLYSRWRARNSNVDLTAELVAHYRQRNFQANAKAIKHRLL